MGKSAPEGTICSGTRVPSSVYLVVFRAQNLITETEGHHQNIYRKLNVSTREEARDAARELKLR
jgi:hypothetical protein